MLHSNLLGRLGNGLLKFVVLVVMACSVSGAFAETISTNTTLSSATTYDDDVTVNPGVTLTISSEVTINGNLTNNGGTIIVGEGGSLLVNGNLENDYASITITSTNLLNLSRITVNGDLINSESSKINLSNGYLVVKGSMDLQDNSVINYNTASSLGEDIQSTINVSGSVIQAENADINLASGAKGKLIVAETYTDNTTTDGNANHPWSITDEGELVMNGGFDLYATKYVSAKLNAKIEEINDLLDDLNEQLAAINGKSLDEYLQTLYPSEFDTYQIGTYSTWSLFTGIVYHPWTDKYSSFSSYLYNENRSFLGALFDFFGANGYGNFTQTMTEQQTETINELRAEIATNTTLKETFEDLIETLEQEGIKALEIATESAAVSTLLPIELASFTATATDYGFVFNWVTASEVENDYFTLEYSIDGVDFNEIDYVHGAGTTSETSEYTYRWDEAPEFDVVYFRLKQTDYNGEYSYSDVIVASRKKSSGANGMFRYGPLNLQIQDGELRYIVK